MVFITFSCFRKCRCQGLCLYIAWECVFLLCLQISNLRPWISRFRILEFRRWRVAGLERVKLEPGVLLNSTSITVQQFSFLSPRLLDFVFIHASILVVVSYFSWFETCAFSSSMETFLYDTVLPLIVKGVHVEWSGWDDLSPRESTTFAPVTLSDFDAVSRTCRSLEAAVHETVERVAHRVARWEYSLLQELRWCSTEEVMPPIFKHAFELSSSSWSLHHTLEDDKLRLQPLHWLSVYGCVTTLGRMVSQSCMWRMGRSSTPRWECGSPRNIELVSGKFLKTACRPIVHWRSGWYFAFWGHVQCMLRLCACQNQRCCQFELQSLFVLLGSKLSFPKPQPLRCTVELLILEFRLASKIPSCVRFCKPIVFASCFGGSMHPKVGFFLRPLSALSFRRLAAVEFCRCLGN